MVILQNLVWIFHVDFVLWISVDCEWEEWKEGECSNECGGGLRTNTRVVKQKAENGGMECSGYSNVTELCNTEHCPGNFLFWIWFQY